MIIKYFEIKKKNLSNFKFFLLYGKNKGLIEETIKNDLSLILPKNNQRYEESEIINKTENFKENIFKKSFFEKDKLIIIQRATDKIFNIINELIEKKLDDVTFILISDLLEKKSKLRSFFEKDKKTVCVAFYEDTNQSLNFVVNKFLKNIKINLSQQNINVIIERSKGDRNNLNNELMKLESFAKNKSNIQINDILKLTNLAENYDISELVENSLAKNQKRIMHILNENNFSNDDCMMIIRIYINKLKRLIKIISDMRVNKNLDDIITNYKPPIFWKEKSLVKKQAEIWDIKKIKELLEKTNSLELQIKKNPSISLYLMTNFILESSENFSN